ncbi:hypothetical protein PCASD_25699 [Puccinia coronata f. sp. avenae]|uniref:Uncharacterized protein n=1 Tax=Puccinia coronata f. sp. avenae TaxID=200324 RepID=A0A2N5TKF7_9BASI|nr:hypothetical protein PCASD_25699 [Puccinia coronata f. sp. avenae]
MIPTKPFLSFIICVVLCVPHSSQSVFTSLFTRKSSQATPLEEIHPKENGPQACKSAFCKAGIGSKGRRKTKKVSLSPEALYQDPKPHYPDALAASEVTKTHWNHEPVSATPSFKSAFRKDGVGPKNRGKTENVRLSPEAANDQGSADTSAGSDSMKTPWHNRIWQRLKDKFLEITHRIRDYWRFIGPVTATALFEPPFSQNPSLTRQVLRLSDEAMKKKIDEFIGMVLEEPKPVLYLQKYEHLKFHPSVRYKLKQSFWRLRPMLLKDAEYKERFNALGLKISNGIKSTMLPRETDLDPVLVLGLEMAAYKSDRLAKDQKMIWKSLPRKQKYLARVLGFLGPKNVLAPHVAVAFKEKLSERKLKWNKEITKDSFVQHLQLLQVELAQVARVGQMTSSLKSSNSKDSLTRHFCDQSISALTNHEHVLIDAFGGRSKFNEALDMIENLDFYQNFKQELKMPRSITGCQLQFLEPWGYEHNYSDIPAEYQLEKKMGIHESQHSLQRIEKQAPVALEIINEKLDIFIQVRKEERRIQNILTPLGLQHFTNYLDGIKTKPKKEK